MTALPIAPVTVDAFLDWSANQPGRHELFCGRIYAMAPERAGHAKIKFAVQTDLARAIKSAGLACHMLPDGMTVRIDETTAHEPDTLVYCGSEVPSHAVEIPNPVIVVEILSPSIRHIDASAKFVGYMSKPSIQHYLIVDPDRNKVIHHRKQADGSILTILVSSPSIQLDPPGLTVDVSQFFA